MAKFRNGFVSNSSSSSFIITNTSDKPLDLLDFAEENLWLVDEFNGEYDWNNYNKKDVLKSAYENNETFKPNVPKICIFGNEDGTLIGQIYDYILRDGGSSENWRWRFNESLR
jgi:hypothetical protein